MRCHSLVLGLIVSSAGCSVDHTIANDEVEQHLQPLPRPVCIELCDYALECGEFAASELVACQLECEDDSVALESSQTNADETIRQIADCYLQTECAAVGTLPPLCHRGDIGGLVPAAPAGGAYSGTMGTTNCYWALENDGLECVAEVSWIDDPNVSLEISCARPDSGSDFDCSCSENGVETATTTLSQQHTTAELLELCWSEDKLSCFYANQHGDDCEALDQAPR